MANAASLVLSQLTLGDSSKKSFSQHMITLQRVAGSAALTTLRDHHLGEDKDRK